MWSENPDDRPDFAWLRAHLADEDALELPDEAPDVRFLQDLVDNVGFVSLHG